MKEVYFGTLKGLKLPVLVYETLAEAVTAGGGETIVLDQVNSNLAYRGPLATGRDIICTLLEDETGIERKMKDTGKVDKDKNPIMAPDESEGEYAKRVCAEKGWDDLTSLQSKLETAARNFKAEGEETAKPLAVDITEKERKAPQPKKLANKYKLTAARIIAAGNIDAFNKNYLAQISKSFTASGDTSKMFKGTYEVVDPVTKKPTGTTNSVEVSDKDAEALGWLIKEYQDWKAAQDQAAMPV